VIGALLLKHADSFHRPGGRCKAADGMKRFVAFIHQNFVKLQAS